MRDRNTHIVNIEAFSIDAARQRRYLRERLAQLSDEAVPPWDFAELQRRGAAQSRRAPTARIQRLAASRLAGIAAALSILVVGAAFWQRLQQTAVVDASVDLPAAGASFEPALVRVGTRAAAGDLEDRIAWMDDLLSESRLQATGDAQLAALERNRSELMNSLVRVRYAEQLLNR